MCRGRVTRHTKYSLRRYGFDGVQAKPTQYADGGLDADAFGKRYGQLAGLVQAGLVVYPGDEFGRWPDIFADVIAFAGTVGAGHLCICCGAGRGGDPVGRARLAAQALSEVGSAAAGRGVSVSIHNHADSIFETEEDLERILDMVDTRLVGLTFDTAHALKGNITDLAGAVRTFAGVLRNVHLKDMDTQGAFCPLGTGVAPLASVLEALGKTGYKEWLIVDEESKAFSTDTAFRISKEYLASHVN